MLAVALGKVFRTALNGRCEARPELAARALPLEIGLPALPCRGGPGLAGRLLGPLGWTVRAEPVPLDPELPQWGDSAYLSVRLTGRLRLADALSQLYVLLPVLDDTKHYWVADAEVDKLIRAGSGWLAQHPERDLITRRYLAHRNRLVLTAVGRLAEVDDTEPEALDNAVPDDEPGDADRRPPLAEQRRAAVLDVLRECGAGTVADLGCGEGTLVAQLLREPAVRRVLGVDVSHRALDRAAQRLHLDTMPDRQRDRVSLLQSSLTYADDRLTGLDAAVLMEVIEHIDPPRLAARWNRPCSATRGPAQSWSPPRTPSTTCGSPAWPRARCGTRTTGSSGPGRQFRDWAGGVAARRGYQVSYRPVGADDPEVGPPTQLAVFTRD